MVETPENQEKLAQLQQRAVRGLARHIFLTKPLEDPDRGVIPSSGVMPIADQNPHMQYRVSRVQHRKPESVAIELPIGTARSKDGELSVDNSSNVAAALKSLGMDDLSAKTADIAYLEHGSGQSGLRILVDDEAYKGLAQHMVHQTINDPLKVAGAIDMDRGHFQQMLQNPESEIFKAVTQLIDVSGYNSGQLAEVMGDAAKSDLHELASHLRDMIKTMPSEDPPRKKDELTLNVTDPGYLDGLMLRNILAAPPVDEKNPSPVDATHVSKVEGTCSHPFPSGNKPKEQFTHPDSVILDLPISQMHMQGDGWFTNGISQIHPALERLGVTAGNLDLGYLGKDERTVGTRILVDSEAYRKMAHEFVCKVVTNPGDAGAMLSYDRDEYTQALHHPNSKPFQTFMNQLEASGNDMASYKQLMGLAAKNDLMEIATAMRDMIDQKRADLGIPKGPRDLGS